MVSPERDEQKAQYLRAIFDTIPLPTFIVDADVRIYDFNSAAEALLGQEPAGALRCRGGEAFHCIHSESSGCGRSSTCRHCVIRNSVANALKGKATCREPHRAELRTAKGDVSMDVLVTTSLLPYTDTPKALLILEDISVRIQQGKLQKKRTPRTLRQPL